MKPAVAILVAVLILIVLLVVYAVSRPSPKTEALSPWDTYERSDGTFDREAQHALRQATARPDPTPADHLLAATILTRNVIGQEHRPLHRPPPTAGTTPAATPAAHEQTRHRRAAYDEARTHYMRALAPGAPVAPAVPAVPAPARGVAPPAPARGVAPPARIVDEALDFAFGGFDLLLGNDPFLAAFIADGWQDLVPAELIMFVGHNGVFAVDTPLAAAALRRQEDIVRDRRKAAEAIAVDRGSAPTGGVAASAYLGMAQQHTSDSQNVHDPGVIACLKAVAGRLRADQGALDKLPGLDAIVEDLKRNGGALSGGRPARAAEAILVAEEARKGERVVALGMSDEESLRRVWARANDPRNAANRDKLRQALFDALVNAWEGHPVRKIVCVYGRVELQLNSLVLLDWDRRNWIVKKMEQFKNDVFILADKAIKQVARKAAASTDPAMQSAGRHFLTESFVEQEAIKVPAGAGKKMRAEVSQVIDKYLEQLETEKGVKGGIPEHAIDKVKTEALAAIMD